MEGIFESMMEKRSDVSIDIINEIMGLEHFSNRKTVKPGDIPYVGTINLNDLGLNIHIYIKIYAKKVNIRLKPIEFAFSEEMMCGLSYMFWNYYSCHRDLLLRKKEEVVVAQVLEDEVWGTVYRDDALGVLDSINRTVRSHACSRYYGIRKCQICRVCTYSFQKKSRPGIIIFSMDKKNLDRIFDNGKIR